MRKEPVVKKGTRYVGLDVHAETISMAVAEPSGEVVSVGTIPNRAESLARAMRKLGPPEKLRVCYEAGPTGYTVYWQLARLGIACDVVAPTLIPVKAGDRVKTDRRDAEKLARSYRSGDLTRVFVPDAACEALRDLVRAREAAKQDQLRARHRLGKFLLRHGRRGPEGVKAWGVKHLEWIKKVRFEELAQEIVLLDYIAELEHASSRIDRLESGIDEMMKALPESMRAVIAGLQCLRGVAQLTAVTIVTEVGDVTRFTSPRQLMSYAGIVSSEYSSGNRTQRGGITKTGNAHLRRVIVEAAWSYQRRPAVGAALKKRQLGQSEKVKEIAWKAQHRLHGRYRRLIANGKPPQKVATAVARELLGFMWAIGIEIRNAGQASTGMHKAA
jgi:transposase